MFTFIDLFAGIGGMRKAFENASGECVFTSEIDKFAQETYNANYPGHDIHSDIREIESEDIPSHDVLLAGFPCQPFSISGVSKRNSLGMKHGFKCQIQGTLFFEIARVLEHHRPKAFLLENVKNLVYHDNGNTYRTIFNTLSEDLDYQLSCRIINSQMWVPQKRERVFIVGFNRQYLTSRDIQSVSLLYDIDAPPSQEWPMLGSLLHSQDETPEIPYTYVLDNESCKLIVNPKYTLSDAFWSCLLEHKRRHRKAGNGFGYRMIDDPHNDVSLTLAACYGGGIYAGLINQHNKNPRVMTPRECARLMGFDDSFVIPVSDSQAYKQFGNSVVVPCVEAIACKMAELLC